MSARNKGLGKGFDALIPTNFDESLLSDSHDRIQTLSVTVLLPNPEQPRQVFEDQHIDDLAGSIKEHGILQPLVVTPHEDRYFIIAGERRWRAAQKAGLKTVPAIVRSVKQLERLELALVENMQRVDLSPLEQAASIQFLHEQFSQDYAMIAKRLSKAATTVQNIVRLLQLPKKVQQALAEKRISEGHARAILGLKDEQAQLALLDLIIQKRWSVRETERYVVAHKQGVKSSSGVQKRVATTTPQTEKLEKVLKTNISVRRMAKGGKLEIKFKNETDLKRLVALLVSLEKR